MIIMFTMILVIIIITVLINSYIINICSSDNIDKKFY